jgi:hypothetical protein
MAESTEPPTTREALERIERLEKRLKLLDKHLFQLWDDFMDFRKAQGDRFESAFERIKNLEVSVFPNLRNDIESVHQIIGGNGVPADGNPLDSRKTSPRNNETGKPESN